MWVALAGFVAAGSLAVKLLADGDHHPILTIRRWRRR